MPASSAPPTGRFSFSRSAPLSLSQTLLRNLLTRPSEIEGKKLKHERFAAAVQDELKKLSPSDLAELFIFAAFLESVSQPLLDQHWLQTQHSSGDDASFSTFLENAIDRELSPLWFLSEQLKSPTSTELKIRASMAHLIVSEIPKTIRTTNISETSLSAFREFSSIAMRGMDALTRFETSVEKSGLLNSMYRTFDEMDKIFGLEYERDIGMKVDPKNTERLYEGAGLGVQTSYSTVLIALDTIAPPQGSRFIDLGSGYGRVGLVVGLLRPDIQFTGYEYVGHRVEVAQASAAHAGLSTHVRYFEQDLSRADFRIPDAEVYYMYDPFSQETYQHVFEQIKEIGRRLPVTVVTKGRANGWFSETIAGEDWEMDRMLDEGTIGVFRSLSPSKSGQA